MNPARARLLNAAPIAPGPVVYWMQRDQRAADNWALLAAASAARQRAVPLLVVFNLVPNYPQANVRHFDFMLRGLAEVERDLAAKEIPFFLHTGESSQNIPAFIAKHGVGQLFTDFSPLHHARSWREAVASKLPIQCVEVDAHNIVPCFVASDKAEFAAYTFRPKINRHLKEWLVDIPTLKTHPHAYSGQVPKIDWQHIEASLTCEKTITPVNWLTPGSRAGLKVLSSFISDRLASYAADRNDPNKDAQSNLSPYLHFGQISAQRVALTVKNCTGMPRESKEAFLEELIVRRELSDNFCFYTEKYDQVAGAHAWAQKTIKEHAADPREFLYTAAEFEAGKTHDELWNAMQRQLVVEGKMHGWCRMYWAKKILEWTNDTQTAITVALELNDRYQLDGRDPNGVVGVMWSVAGVHDRAWTERPIFGKIRYMNFAGAKRKFDVATYIARYSPSPNLFNETNQS